MVGANAILGIHWLTTLGRVITYYKQLYIEFVLNGETIKWSRHPWVDNNPLSSRELKYLQVEEQEGHLLHMELKCHGIEEVNNLEIVDELLKKITKCYEDTFSAPTTLPPIRQMYYYIHTKPNSKLVFVKPYRYPQHQKTEIEILVKEML